MGTYFYVPLEALAVPRSGECLADYWWTFKEDEGCLFWTWRTKLPPLGVILEDVKPQANQDKNVCDFLISRLHPGHRSLHVPIAYMANARDRARKALEELK